MEAKKEQQEYQFSIDKKVACWVRETFYIKADDYESAKKEAIRQFHDDDNDTIEFEIIDGTDYDPLPWGAAIIDEDGNIWEKNFATKELWSNEYNDETNEPYEEDYIINNVPIEVLREQKLNKLFLNKKV